MSTKSQFEITTATIDYITSSYTKVSDIHHSGSNRNLIDNLEDRFEIQYASDKTPHQSVMES